MARQINYDDDIFYLTFLVKRMRDGIRLDLDESLFTEHIRGDISFVEEAITHIHRNLINNELMIRRGEYLSTLR